MHRICRLAICLAITLLAASTSPVSDARQASAAIPGAAAPTARADAGTPEDWYRNGAERAAANGAMRGRARNVILFLGDGMGQTTVTAARILQGQRRGESGEENELAWESFPHTALNKTYNTDSQTPDSAGTMTAITTGVKSHKGAIAVAAGRTNDCAGSLQRPLLTWLQLADSAGLATGIVTTTRITHATPAATYAHSPNRNWESDADLPARAVEEGCVDIARQLLSASRFGRGPSVVLGGGRREFTTVAQRDPEQSGKTGRRTDGRDLVAEWQQAQPRGAYVWNTRQLRAASQAPAILGLFQSDHMQHEHDRDRSDDGEPSLAEMTVAAIKSLSRNPGGYVLLVEGGRIDHAHHDGNAFRALDETIALSDAVRAAMQATSTSDTLVLVTADHSHTLSFNGYPMRGNPILGKVQGSSGEGDGKGEYALDATGKVFTTLSYANGPGNTGASDRQPAGSKTFPHAAGSFSPVQGRPDLRTTDTGHPDYLQEALVPLKSESHSAEDVGVWASGPGSEAVRGTLEQNTLYHFIVQATPKLRKRLCAAKTCNAQGVPVELPRPADFEKK